MKRLFFALVFSVFSVCAFASRVISPVEGRFANRQCLILDVSDGAEAFYSYTSTNPLVSGFAYDGPVLIDVGGEVSLSVVVIRGEEREQYEIAYSVSDAGNSFAPGSAERTFIDRILSENVLLCAGESVIQIPPSLSFSVGDGEKPVIKDGTLSVSADNRLSRYVPCTVTNGNLRWRFIIYLSGGEAGSFSQSSVPFELSDWETFRFTGKNLIWSIDGGLWSASRESVPLDRTKSHVISWQDVAYKSGNPIQSFELPPKPALETAKIGGAAVSFAINGDARYRLSVLTSGAEGEAHENSGLYPSLTFDTCAGDYVSATAVFALYVDGVYQGTLSAPYVIDRQPPIPPLFVASEPGEYARRDVTLRLDSERGSSVYVCVLGPYEVNSNSYLDNNAEFDYVRPGEYVPYDGTPFILRAGVEKTVCYRAFAYAKDDAGNVSAVSGYKVIIDEYNYFLDGSAPDFAADGSRLHPYNSFEQVLRVINEGSFVHFFVSGTVTLPRGASVISSNCSFTGMADARLVLPSSSFIMVKDASIEMQNCAVVKELDSSARSDQRLFVVERAAASFEDCELLGNFDSSGTALSVDSSIVTFRNSGLTVQSATYACAISALNSKISLAESRFASVADTAVNFSMKGGSIDLVSSECTVISHLGRILESTGANLRLSSNTYTGDFDRETKGVFPIWKDEKSLVIEDKNNVSKGF